MTASENFPVQMAGFAAATLLNTLSRRNLSYFFERVWFYNSRSPLPVDPLNDIRTTHVALTPRKSPWGTQRFRRHSVDYAGC